ncbi:MAG TPA: twin-arginine translocation signal domain-containing protein, partial [Pirellulaceae bacterium]|nr:twin-arginine translocation signal domain-containing protein [Pirellulaceae bacterium]
MQSTSRRKFLAAVSAAAAVSTSGLVPFSPRVPGFLLESAAYGAEKGGERILVVVQLSGGNDGLNTVVPYADEFYRKERPSLAIASGGVIKIDGSIGLHPSLSGFNTLLENRQLAIVQGVGYPNPNRSHFESMDIWHSARSNAGDRKLGWLGRAFDARAAELNAAGDPPAMHLGAEVQPLALAARDVPSP